MSTAWVFAIAPAIAAALLIAAIARSPWARVLQDRPNERSLHERATPRVGGLGLIAAALAFTLAAADAALGAIATCAAFLCGLSLMDDARSLPIEVRLPGHALAAAMAVLALGAMSGFGWLAAGALTLAIVWMTNLFNFMDGADGLAGGMAAIGFGALAAAAFAAGSTPLALASTAIASASLGFLLHNFPPARVFLGDAGSVPLGFLAGAFAAYGIAHGVWPAWFPLLVFSPFIVDATVTLAARVLRGERFWRAHRAHAYQRLVLSGWSHRRLALSAYALMLAAASSALWALTAGEAARYAIILLWLVTYLFLLAAVGRRTRRQA